MRPIGWEKQERLALGTHPPRPRVEDDLTKVIGLLDRMLTEYHGKRPDKPLRTRST